MESVHAVDWLVVCVSTIMSQVIIDDQALDKLLYTYSVCCDDVDWTCYFLLVGGARTWLNPPPVSQQKG